MRKRKQPGATFADLVKEPTWSQSDASRSGQHAPRPGRFNGAGEFFDLSGSQLELVVGNVPAEEAQRLLEAGAALVSESCGCGGSYGDCTPVWATDKQLHELRSGPPPQLTDRHSAPTWLDAWAGERGSVVFAHGDISWGNVLD
ncbi:hypothetical protein [Terrabacter carboxydivorans]|uniref:Aminoglycoside phosphotransferase domain-containing protein n=1 Tax=Terrabacter carboxydivorans TaxID=619730 RepID=A0ABP5YTQ1_9MICO